MPNSNTRNALTLFFLLLLFQFSISHSALKKPPPFPILPLPSAAQLRWQLSELAIFLHFGMNTYTDSEWGTGHADPTLFNPSRLNASQWVQVAKDAGFSRVILTAKHHDGFCLWPSDYTDYSVRASPWRNGGGDLVAELAAAAKKEGIQLGVYLSPWDRHEACYGKTLEYNEFYVGQMTELLTRYGEISEVFLDGAKEEGEKAMEYYFDSWFSLIHQLQPGAVIFSEAGPDTRWVGDEDGVAGSTCWSLFNRSNAIIGGTDPLYMQEGDRYGHDWVPAECDVSIRPGWFWHASESPKPALQLLDIYYKSVGRNCLLLLNIPPNSSGLISEHDIQSLQEFKKLRDSIFSINLAKASHIEASSTRGGDKNPTYSPLNVLEKTLLNYWAPEENQRDWFLHFDLQKTTSFNVLQVQEPVHIGQRVIAFHLEALDENGWKIVTNGSTIGYTRLLRFPVVESRWLKFVIHDSRADPLISFFGIYMDTFSISAEDTVRATSRSNGIRGIKRITRANASTPFL